MKLTHNEQHELERLKETLGPERTEGIEEQIEMQKAAQRYRELREKESGL